MEKQKIQGSVHPLGKEKPQGAGNQSLISVENHLILFLQDRQGVERSGLDVAREREEIFGRAYGIRKGE